MKRNPTNLLLAPVGAGKTEIALDLLHETIRQRPFAKIWVLLPTKRQIHHFRQRMVLRDPARRSFFNMRFFDFYTLYHFLLDAAGTPQRCLDEPGRMRLLREILYEMQAELILYGEIAHTPGFVRIMADFIYELKQNLVFPDFYRDGAETQKDIELADIYAAYQTEMQNNDLVDREGEGWLALEAVTRGDLRPGDLPHLLLVDGYDQFNRMQASLIAALAAHTEQTLVTLTTVPEREGTIGKRFENAFARLAWAHVGAQQKLEAYPLPALADARQPALRYLLDHIFLPRPSASAQGADGQNGSAANQHAGIDSSVVRFIEAPDARQEVGAVLRQVKALLLDGCRPDDILIAVRDWQGYAQYINSTAEMYDLLPLLALQYGETLEENPAIHALFDLLDLPRIDFRRRELMDVLGSPYFELHGLDGEWMPLLNRVANALFVTGGRKQWLDAIRLAKTTPSDPEDEDSPRILTEIASKQLEEALERFFDRVTPPPEASVSAYVRWIEMLIGPDPETDPDEEATVEPDVASLNMIARMRKPAAPGVVERDLAAMEKLKDALRAFLSTQELFEAIGRDDIVTWEAFWADLKASAARSMVQREPSHDGRVLVTVVNDARGLPHSHVFILGLSEGIFPAKVPEDPLYLDSEREALVDRGIPLPKQSERADDGGLFYELISLARETLTLSRPYTKDGAHWPASHLWRKTMEVFDQPHVERMRLGAVIVPERAACLQEAALSVADGLNVAMPGETTAAAYNWLVERKHDYWMPIQVGRAIEMSRMSARHPYDQYSGRLSDSDLIVAVRDEWFSPAHAWSASQLNDYGMCAFRFYAGRVMGLEMLTSPEDGMTVLQAGTIQHAILEETYKRFGALGKAITPENAEEALAILREAAREHLKDAPRRYGFIASALWEQEKHNIERRLEALVRLDFSGKSPLDNYGEGERQPYRLEAKFGPIGTFGIPLGDDVGTLRVAGKIDRIDIVGDKAIIVDYKSGTTKIESDELAHGRNFQMMVYLLAAENILANDGNGYSVEAGVFWSIRSRKPIGDLRRDEEGTAAIGQAQRHLHDYMVRGRQGDFASEANKMEEGKCSRYCEFHTLCRIGVLSKKHK